MDKKGTAREERTIPLSFKRFPQSIPHLTSLGFDETCTSSSCIVVRKHSGGCIMPGKGLLFALELRKDSAKISYDLPPGCDPASRRLRAAAMFMHLLLLFEGAKVDAKGMAQLLQPSLDEADWLLSSGSELLAKRQKELVSEMAKASSSNKRLVRELEKANLLAMEKERRIAALLERLSRLERVSDQSLREMLLEWLRAHRGRFDSAEFAKSSGISPSRAEEGLEALLGAGEIREVGGALREGHGSPRRIFEERSGALSAVFGAASWLGKKPKH